MMLLLAFLALSHAGVATTPAAAASDPEPLRQVITRNQIETAGLYRVADLLRLIDAARTTTVDGLTWRVSLLAGDPFSSEEWTLLLDGHRLDLDVLGQTNLSLLPVAITQIDSVEVWTAPRMVAGTFAAGGAIHIHTAQRQEAGVGGRLGAAIGLQNGDPGPFRYIPEMATVNVDKFGGDYEGWAGAAGERWRASARLLSVRFYPTDEAAFERNHEILNGAEIPRSRLVSGALRLEADALGGRHSVQLLGGGHADLWFFEPFGRELSTQRYFGQATLRGTFGRPAMAPNSGPVLAYRLSISENRLDKRFERSLGPDPAWKGQKLRAGAQASAPLGDVLATIGGELERHLVDGARGYTLGRFSGTVARPRVSGSELLEASLAVGEGDVATSVALSSQHTLGPASILASAALAQRLPVETGRWGFWKNRGYDAFDDVLTIDGSVPGVVTTGQVRLDIGYSITPAISATAGVGLRSFSDLYAETIPWAADPDDPGAARSEIGRVAAAGSIAHWRGTLEGQRAAWRGRLSVDAQLPVGGDEVFDRAMRRVPRYRAGLRGSVAPAPTFTLSGALGYQSAATWPEYTHLTGGNAGLYDAAVPATWLLDVALEKWFWRKRLRGSLSFLNLLDQQERYHPVGATLSRRIYLRVELRLG